jgi:hypothetical protein
MPLALALRRNSSLAARDSGVEDCSEGGAAGWDVLGALECFVACLVEEEDEEAADVADDGVLCDLVEVEDATGSSRLVGGCGDGSLVEW